MPLFFSFLISTPCNASGQRQDDLIITIPKTVAISFACLGTAYFFFRVLQPPSLEINGQMQTELQKAYYDASTANQKAIMAGLDVEKANKLTSDANKKKLEAFAALKALEATKRKISAELADSKKSEGLLQNKLSWHESVCRAQSRQSKDFPGLLLLNAAAIPH